MSSRLLCSRAVLILCPFCGAAWASARGPVEEDCAGNGRPACTQPPAAVVSPHQLHAALAPVFSLAEFDDCSLPRATCLHPAAATVVPVRCAVTTGSIPSASDALRLWEQSASLRIPVSERDRSWLSRRNEPDLSAHVVEAAARLLGPVRSSSLVVEFEWIVASASAANILLEGRPHDDAARLFCPKTRVTLDRATGAMAELEVLSREGRWIVVKLPDPMGPDAAVIKLAAFESPADESAVPPSPVPQRIVAEPTDRPAVR